MLRIQPSRQYQGLELLHYYQRLQNSVPDKSGIYVSKVSVLTANDKINGGKKTRNPDAEAKLSPTKAATIVVSIPMVMLGLPI